MITTTCVLALVLVAATPEAPAHLAPVQVCQTTTIPEGMKIDSRGNVCADPVTMIKAGIRTTLCPGE